jgi:hypothetical protein
MTTPVRSITRKLPSICQTANGCRSASATIRRLGNSRLTVAHAGCRQAESLVLILKITIS